MTTSVKFKVGDKVTVHDPAWNDATGRRYEAGKYHSRTGTIVAVTDYRVGAELMYDVELEGGLVRKFWTSELKLTEVKHE